MSVHGSELHVWLSRDTRALLEQCVTALEERESRGGGRLVLGITPGERRGTAVAIAIQRLASSLAVEP